MLKQQQANIPVYMKDMDVTGTDTRAAETPRSYLVNVTRLDSVTCYDVSDSTLYIHLGLELAETKTLYLLVNESLNKPVKQTFFKLFGPETNQNNQHPKRYHLFPVSKVISRVQPVTIPAILSFPKHYLQTQNPTLFLPIINKRNPSTNALHMSTISALPWSIIQTKDLRWVNRVGIIWCTLKACSSQVKEQAYPVYVAPGIGNTMKFANLNISTIILVPRAF